MAPEIMRGENYDESSYVYSYEIVLWELFNKEIPF
jgi:serine/threonine protein kinase